MQRPGQIDLKAKTGFQNSLGQIEFTEGCAPGQIEFVLKAKIAFQKVLGEIHFTQDLVWVKLARRNAHTKHEFPAKLV